MKLRLLDVTFYFNFLASWILSRIINIKLIILNVLLQRHNHIALSKAMCSKASGVADVKYNVSSWIVFCNCRDLVKEAEILKHKVILNSVINTVTCEETLKNYI